MNSGKTKQNKTKTQEAITCDHNFCRMELNDILQQEEHAANSETKNCKRKATQRTQYCSAKAKTNQNKQAPNHKKTYSQVKAANPDLTSKVLQASRGRSKKQFIRDIFSFAIELPAELNSEDSCHGKDDMVWLVCCNYTSCRLIKLCN